jgi:F-type H+-transporting ATPase subunit delta
MLWAFIEQYRHANNIKVGSIVTAVEIEGLKERLESLFHEKTGAQVQLSVDVVPDILGGFIFELDGYRVDASVENHLAQIRRKLIEPNNRIV